MCLVSNFDLFYYYRVPDEWILEKDYTAKKNVSIPNLGALAKTELNPVLFPQEEVKPKQKHQRKPNKLT